MSSARLPRLGRAFYRARQFFASLRPPRQAGEGERQDLADFLSGALLRLFLSMTPRDQRHCLDVFLALRRQGCEDRDVLTAALLHDSGKGQVRLWHRVAYVLLAAAFPFLLSHVGGGIAALRDHAARGASLAAAAGAPPAVARLIRDHEGRRDAHVDEKLALIQNADDSC